MDLTEITAHQPTVAELQAELAELKVRFHKQQALRLKVSEKGGVSLYGLNVRFPITLYGEQWDRLLAFAPEIEKFLTANRSKLSTKADKKAAEAAKKVN
jgi:hypothetical protein